MPGARANFSATAWHFKGAAARFSIGRRLFTARRLRWFHERWIKAIRAVDLDTVCPGFNRTPGRMAKILRGRLDLFGR